MSNTVQIEKTNSSIRKVCFLGSKYVVDLCGHLLAINDRKRTTLVELVLDESRFNQICGLEFFNGRTGARDAAKAYLLKQRGELEKIKLDYSKYMESLIKDVEEIPGSILSRMMSMYTSGPVDDYVLELSGLPRKEFEKRWYHVPMHEPDHSKIVDENRAIIIGSIRQALYGIDKFTDLPKIAEAAHKTIKEVMMSEYGEKRLADKKALIEAVAKELRHKSSQKNGNIELVAKELRHKSSQKNGNIELVDGYNWNKYYIGRKEEPLGMKNLMIDMLTGNEDTKVAIISESVRKFGFEKTKTALIGDYSENGSNHLSWVRYEFALMSSDEIRQYLPYYKLSDEMCEILKNDLKEGVRLWDLERGAGSMWTVNMALRKSSTKKQILRLFPGQRFIDRLFASYLQWNLKKLMFEGIAP